MNTEDRRRGSLRAIAAEVPRIVAPALGRRGFAEATMVAEWAAIIGAELADKLVPEKLSFPRGTRRDGTLRLKVAPGVALEVQHREPQLLERINAFFGFRAVARLALVQGPIETVRRPAAPEARPLTPDERQGLDHRLDAIEDPDLRAALKRLGEAVIGQAQR